MPVSPTAIFLRFLFKETTPYASFDSKEIVKKHSSRLRVIAFWMILVAAFFIYIAIESDSPNYSVLGVLGSVSGHSSEDVSSDKSILEGAPFAIDQMSYKIAFILGVIFLLFIQVYVVSPFSDPSLLLRWHMSPEIYPKRFWSKYLLTSLSRDVKAYAKMLPSARLPKLCTYCGHSNTCPSYLHTDGSFLDNHSFSIWQALYENGSLPPSTLSRLTNSAYLCRFVYMVKLVCLNVMAVALLSFICHRILEFGVLEKVALPIIPIIVFSFSAIVFHLVNQLNDSSDHENLGGVWSRYSNSIKEMSSDLRPGFQPLAEVYIKKICEPGAGGKIFMMREVKQLSFEQSQIVLLSNVLKQLDLLVVDKLTLLLKKARAVPLSHQQTILNSIKCFLEQSFSTAGPFTVEVVRELSVKSFANVPNNSILRIVKDGLSRNTEHLPHCCISKASHAETGAFKVGIGSVLVAKIDFSSQHRDYLARRLYMTDASQRSWDEAGFGWLIITAASPDVFLDIEDDADIIPLRPFLPFIHRLAFEFSRDGLNNRG